MDIDRWITAVLALRKARNVVVFTGAGISAESGIPTFRDADGFWQRFPPEQFAHWGGLLKTAMTDPHRVAEFVFHVVDPIARAAPNAAHRAVAAIEQRTKCIVVTQNVDGLHQSAGSTNVQEVHGSLLEVVDKSSRKLVKVFERAELCQIADLLKQYSSRQITTLSFVMQLKQQYPFDWLGRHRPNLVLFGDELAEPAWTNACAAVDACDLLLSIGTSGAVYPAAMLPDRAAVAGTTVVSVDPKPAAGCWLQGPASEIVPKLVQEAFTSQPPGSTGNASPTSSH
jgi:NAD-dependent deacetylase